MKKKTRSGEISYYMGQYFDFQKFFDKNADIFVYFEISVKWDACVYMTMFTKRRDYVRITYLRVLQYTSPST